MVFLIRVVSHHSALIRVVLVFLSRTGHLSRQRSHQGGFSVSLTYGSSLTTALSSGLFQCFSRTGHLSPQRSHQGGFSVSLIYGLSPTMVLSSAWSLIRVISYHSALLGWSHMRWTSMEMVFHQGGLSLGWYFHQGGDLSSWYFIRVIPHQGDLCQGGLSSAWSLIRVVSHQRGLSSAWSLIRVSGWSLTRIIVCRKEKQRTQEIMSLERNPFSNQCSCVLKQPNPCAV